MLNQQASAKFIGSFLIMGAIAFTLMCLSCGTRPTDNANEGYSWDRAK